MNPGSVKAAIVTCGGLCPGLNDVIRQLVITLEEYGVKDIKGIRYGMGRSGFGHVSFVHSTRVFVTVCS